MRSRPPPPHSSGRAGTPRHPPSGSRSGLAPVGEGPSAGTARCLSQPGIPGVVLGSPSPAGGPSRRQKASAHSTQACIFPSTAPPATLSCSCSRGGRSERAEGTACGCPPLTPAQAQPHLLGSPLASARPVVASTRPALLYRAGTGRKRHCCPPAHSVPMGEAGASVPFRDPSQHPSETKTLLMATPAPAGQGSALALAARPASTVQPHVESGARLALRPTRSCPCWAKLNRRSPLSLPHPRKHLQPTHRCLLSHQGHSGLCPLPSGTAVASSRLAAHPDSPRLTVSL